ncbi:MAG: hypothetical protein ACI4Q5_01210, partial [Porcipelethomonas sp.]
PIMKIISKIGVRELKNCFDLNELKSADRSSKKAVTAIGVSVALEAADVILRNIGSCEKDIYSFLADLSGMSAKEIPELEMSDFADMIHTLVSKEEFGDFFTAVLKFFPEEK